MSPAHTAHQDHNIYMTSKNAALGANGYVGVTNGLVEYNLLTGTPNGRGTKIGAINSGDGNPHGNTLRYNTYYGNYGPSQIQLSFGASANVFDHNILKKPEDTNQYVIGYSSGSFLLTGTGNSATNNYGAQCKGVVQTGNAGLTDGGGNVVADPGWDGDYTPSLAALLTGGTIQYGHLRGLTSASGWSYDTTATPTLTSVSPGTIQAGASAFTLTVNGTEFDNDLIDASNTAVVKWGGTALTTTFVTATQLTASVPASRVVGAGTVNITATNPRGTTTSGTLTFVVSPPPTDPFISSLSPSTCLAGAAQFTDTLSGVNFDATCVVTWGGTALTTTFVDQFTLTAVVPAAKVAAAYSPAVVVTKTGSNNSNSATFTVTAAAPTLTSITPASTQAGHAAMTITLTGVGFDATSVVTWAGSDRTTHFTNSTTITADLLVTDLDDVGTFAVAVRLPGGTSNSVQFTLATPPEPPGTTRVERHRWSRLGRVKR